MRQLNKSINDLCAELCSTFDSIDPSRAILLNKLANYIYKSLLNTGHTKLTYICTHNSRRSHFGQIWGMTASTYFGIEGIETFSGGTEETAFHLNAIAALKRAGLRIEIQKAGLNPVFSIELGEDLYILCFSKKYNHPSNPADSFIAAMTCTEADQGCPIVEGASYRISLPYDDPKHFDGTQQETAMYDQRFRQIGLEQLYVFYKVKQMLKIKP